MRSPQLERIFPNLQTMPYSVESDFDVSYNCIAWAAGENHRWWWPGADGYWPPDAPQEETLDAFIAAYSTCGYSLCDTGTLEAGIEKIAIYALGGKPTHAARQLSNGMWTSKCGKLNDLEHTLEGIVNNRYGMPVVFMCRFRS